MHRLIERVRDGSVNRLLLVAAVPEESISLAREGAGHPRVAVINPPDGDTDTLGVTQAGLDDVGVVGALLGDLGGVRWEGHTDVQFGDGHVQASCGELVDVSALVWDGAVADD